MRIDISLNLKADSFKTDAKRLRFCVSKTVTGVSDKILSEFGRIIKYPFGPSVTCANSSDGVDVMVYMEIDSKSYAQYQHCSNHKAIADLDAKKSQISRMVEDILRDYTAKIASVVNNPRF